MPRAGRAFFPFQITDVANAFAEIQDELRSQYALSYKPADLKRMADTTPSRFWHRIIRDFECGAAAVIRSHAVGDA